MMVHVLIGGCLVICFIGALRLQDRRLRRDGQRVLAFIRQGGAELNEERIAHDLHISRRRVFWGVHYGIRVGALTCLPSLPDGTFGVYLASP